MREDEEGAVEEENVDFERLKLLGSQSIDFLALSWGVAAALPWLEDVPCCGGSAGEPTMFAAAFSVSCVF